MTMCVRYTRAPSSKGSTSSACGAEANAANAPQANPAKPNAPAKNPPPGTQPKAITTLATIATPATIHSILKCGELAGGSSVPVPRIPTASWKSRTSSVSSSSSSAGVQSLGPEGEKTGRRRRRRTKNRVLLACPPTDPGRAKAVKNDANYAAHLRLCSRMWEKCRRGSPGLRSLDPTGQRRSHSTVAQIPRQESRDSSYLAWHQEYRPLECSRTYLCLIALGWRVRQRSAP